MTEYICKEVQTDNGGYLEPVKELIRCKDCKWYDMTDAGGTFEPIVYRCRRVSRLWREPHDFCSRAEKIED